MSETYISSEDKIAGDRENIWTSKCKVCSVFTWVVLFAYGESVSDHERRK